MTTDPRHQGCPCRASGEQTGGKDKANLIPYSRVTGNGVLSEIGETLNYLDNATARVLLLQEVTCEAQGVTLTPRALFGLQLSLDALRGDLDEARRLILAKAGH